MKIKGKIVSVLLKWVNNKGKRLKISKIYGKIKKNPVYARAKRGINEKRCVFKA
jgi:hypothetical protein